MLGKHLKRLFGKKLGTIADTIIDEAADKATHGLSTAAEKAVTARKRAKSQG